MGRKTIKAELITIGDELLYGQTLDTNTQWMSIALTAIGVQVVHKSSLGDEEIAILAALHIAAARADIVLITGGLGPTRDDLTKDCLAKYFGTGLKLHEAALEQISTYFKGRNRMMNQLNRDQALLPENCTYLPNTVGTAPGMWFESTDTIFVSMPGVPHEMKTLMKDHVIPRLQQHFDLPEIAHLMLRTVGLAESIMAEKLSTFEDELPDNISLAYLPSLGEVRLRLTARGDDKLKMQADLMIQKEKIYQHVGKYIYGEGDTSLSESIGKLLQGEKYKLATAESCTGGRIGHKLVTVHGSSSHYDGGIIAYNNTVKQHILNVPKAILEQHGAVSEETVKAMAEGVCKLLKSDYGLASTGIAGPSGGSDEKPVGTVWIGLATPEQTIAKKYSFGKDRLINIELTATIALGMLWQSLREKIG